MKSSQFTLRVRIGNHEVEVSGAKDEVIDTLNELEEIVRVVYKAFNSNKVGIGKETLKKSSEGALEHKANYPHISSTKSCSDAIVELLSTDWGKTPRTLGELREALEANAIFYPKTTLSGVLVWLVKKERLRRWKTKRGYVYVLAKPEAETEK